MKLKSLLFISALAAGVHANAQTWVTDSVEMGAGYANDIFYNLSTGDSVGNPGNNWDIAFQINKFGDPSFNASIRANHAKTGRKVEVYSLHMAVNATTFAAISASDTVGKTSRNMQLMNIDTSWGEGAFTQNRDLTDLFDFGWGKYQGPPNHDLVGDSVYLVKVNGTPYKLWVQQYISMVDTLIGYKFRVANWDNTMDNSVYVKKKDYPDRLFVYYDIATNTFINREPNRNNWDLMFTQYYKKDPNGGPMMGGPMPITFTGVLHNLKVTVAEVKTADPDTVKHTNYLGSFSPEINAIGDDWKKTVGSPPSSYAMDTVTYFVRSFNSQEYIQIKFTQFTGTIGGAPAKIVFDKRVVGVTTVKDVTNNVSTYAIVPNPATNDANFAVEVKEQGEARLMVSDITGKVMLSRMVNLKKGLNAFGINTSEYAAGTYIITIGNGSWKISDKLIIQH